MRPSYNAPEAPTHLRAGDLPPGLLDDVDPPTSAVRPSSYHSASAARTQRRGEPAALPGLPPYDPERSVVSVSRSRSRSAVVAPRVRTEPSSMVTPLGRPARSATPRPVAHPGARPDAHHDAHHAHPGAKPAAQAVRAGSAAQPLPPPDKPASVAQPTPAAPAAGAMPPGLGAMPGLGAIDPLAIPTPPELAGPSYSHIRRLALQADLAGADRVLRDALAELTSSLSCSIVYPGQDGLWTLGNDTDIPRDAQPLVAVATARRAVIASHTALIPVVTTTETVAVITLTRNPRQPAYQIIEQVAMIALAREAAPILHHLAVQHLQHASELQADKGSLNRGEALEAHRTRGQEGTLVQLSPAWVKRAYPLLVITMLAAIGFAVFIKVPTYSTGSAVITFEGSMSVTATATGTVEKVFIKENEAVKKGDPLIRLNSPQEASQLAASETEWRDAEIQFLFDQTDPQVAKQLKTAATARDHSLATVEARTIRAPRDGVVTNLHVKEGVAVQLGGYILQITDENSDIEVLAFLPGTDGPRIRDAMPLQLELEGYTKARAIATITHVQPDVVSGTEAAKLAGDMLAESVARELQTGTWISVRARLPSRTFKAEHSTYHYHHGMHAKVEVKIRSKPFLVTLLPALEKYLPE